MEDILYNIGLQINDIYTLLQFCSINRIVRYNISNLQLFWVTQFNKYNLPLGKYIPLCSYKWIQLFFISNITEKFRMSLKKAKFNVKIPIKHIKDIMNKVLVNYSYCSKTSNIGCGKPKINDIVNTYPFVIDKITIIDCPRDAWLQLYVYNETGDATMDKFIKKYGFIKFGYGRIATSQIQKIIMGLVQYF